MATGFLLDKPNINVPFVEQKRMQTFYQGHYGRL
jgi:hypothetical protein